MSIPPQKPLYEALLPDSDKINQLQNFFTRPVLGTFYSNAENACKSLQILEEPEQLRWYKNYIYLYQLYTHYAEKLQPSDADTLSIQEELTSLRQQLERTKVNESTIFKTWKSLSAENDDLHTEIAKLRHQLQNSASAVNRQPQQEQEITSLKSQIQELTSRCHNLGERLENSYATIKKLKEEASSAKEKLRQAETEIAVQPEQSSSPQEEFLQLQRENWELRNQNQMLAQSSLQSQANLQQCYEVIRNLRMQIQNADSSEPSAPSSPQEEAIPLLQALMQAQISKTELSQELHFLQLEQNCLSEFIAALTPETDDFQLPVLQKKLAENAQTSHTVQEQIVQIESQISELHNKLNLLYL